MGSSTGCLVAGRSQSQPSWETMLIAAMLSLLMTQGAPPPADEARARKFVARADKEYAVGEFDKALADYRDAYSLKPVPALLFNLGQAAKQTRDYRQSAF